MKTTLQTIFLIFTFSISGIAQQITSEEASLVAHNSMYEKINKYGTATGFDEINPVLSYTHYTDKIPAYYVFEMNDQGFVIVAAQKTIHPIIGYSFTGKFPHQPDPFSNFGSFMTSYTEMIQYSLENKIEASDEVKQAWAHLSTSDITQLNTSSKKDYTTPLVSSLWNQDYPYNIMAPEDPEGPGGHAYAGCVATAMSQVMHYWRYPHTGQGTHSYYSNYGYLSVNYGETGYDWSGMLNVITYTNPWPIAELQYHAGVGVDMNYTPNGSGSNMVRARDAMDNYFKYAESKLNFKEDYTHQGWIDLLKEQINNGYPIAYAGYSSNSGHAFVCDGYQDDYFHFNFGWSGTANGFYSLSSVNGFSNGQQGVMDVYPVDPEYPYFITEDVELNEKSASFTDGSGPVEDYKNNTSASWLINPQTAADSISNIILEISQFELGANDNLLVYDGETTSAPLLGTYSGTDGPGTITSTGNKMLVVLQADASGTGPGFYAEYRSVIPEYCQSMAVFSDQNGTVSDGSGTFNYNNNTVCYYQIKPETDKNIILQFSRFETEAEHDILLVYDNTTKIGSFSGNELPEVLEATSGVVTLIFKTNSMVTGDGWEINYETGYLNVEENNAFNNLQLYPNPAGDFVNLIFSNTEEKQTQIRITDVSGSLLYQQRLQNGAGNFSLKIPTNKLENGVYLLVVENSEGSVIKKLVVNK